MSANPFADPKEYSSDANPFADPSIVDARNAHRLEDDEEASIKGPSTFAAPTAQQSQPDLGSRFEDLQRREQELARREEALTARAEHLRKVRNETGRARTARASSPRLLRLVCRLTEQRE